MRARGIEPVVIKEDEVEDFMNRYQVEPEDRL